jgi:oligoendopeptidase F
MISALPNDINPFMAWSWDQIKPFADELVRRPLAAENVDAWLADWSLLASLIGESFTRLQVRTTTHTNDEAGQKRFQEYAEQVIPQAREFEQQLKEKLLASGLEPAGFSIPLRRMRTDAAIFRSENLPILTEIERLGVELDKIHGAMMIDWDGAELTRPQAVAKLQDPDRSIRERAWRKLAERVSQDREAMDAIWVQLLDLRQRQAHNAGFDNYRDFRWQELGRFDYTPADCRSFHAAIEAVVVPVASRLNARRKARLGVDTLRVWDGFWFLSPDAAGRPPLKPYQTLDELNDKIEAIFSRVDPQLGSYYHFMRERNLLDLESRKHKASGGYMTEFSFTRQPFIFTNAVGNHDNVQTLLHEGGHAFHSFESAHLPYLQQRSEGIPIEFAEVASMSMELLAAPYLTADQGGFYSAEDAARARVEHLEGSLRFWPYMAVVDAFQHWIYEHPDLARDTRQCDQAWFDLHRRYMPDYDWSGIEDTLKLYWRLQGHIWGAPFYYVEYGLAQVGAVQVWSHAIQDQAGAVAAYRRALALGTTVTLPELFQAAGARLAFDADMLRGLARLMEDTINRLDPA